MDFTYQPVERYRAIMALLLILPLLLQHKELLWTVQIKIRLHRIRSLIADLHCPIFLSHLSTKCSRWSIVIGLIRRLSVRPFTITKKSPKLMIRIQSNFTKMILRSCSFKILQRIEFNEELWLPWQQSEKTLKIFLSQTIRAGVLASSSGALLKYFKLWTWSGN